MKYVSLDEANTLVREALFSGQLTEEELIETFDALGEIELSRSELERLYAYVQRGDSSVIQEIVNAYTPMVFGMAKKYLERGLSLRGLVREGRKGVEEALEHFEPARGYKFGTYASWWIRQAMINASSLDDKAEI